MTYNFPPPRTTADCVVCGRVTGENVSYTYDSLNRLIAAATTNRTGPIWATRTAMMVLVPDGKTVTQGSAPSALPQVNSATNQARMIGDYGFDANGNWLGTGSQSTPGNVGEPVDLERHGGLRRESAHVYLRSVGQARDAILGGRRH